MTSRGVALTTGPSWASLTLGSVAGAPIVGWDNLMGLAESSHRAPPGAHPAAFRRRERVDVREDLVDLPFKAILATLVWHRYPRCRVYVLLSPHARRALVQLYLVPIAEL